MNKSILTIVLLLILSGVMLVNADTCTEYDPYVAPVWPSNDNMQFAVSQITDTNLIVTLSKVAKYPGAIQYLRMTALDSTNPNITSSASFDSGFTAELNGESYNYTNYASMFSNDKYSSVDNDDCTVDITANFPILSILKSTDIFQVIEEPNVIKVDVPFYLGYAVTSRQSDEQWVFHENLFIAHLVINTLVRSDGTKDVINSACSTTSQNQKGVIFCSYSSTSPIEMSQFSITVTDISLNMYTHYSSGNSGRAQVQFRTVDNLQGLTQFHAQIGASMCIVTSGGACESTTDYKSPVSAFSFQTGAGTVTLTQEAQIFFSDTITKFDSTTDNKTVIGSTPEFYLLVRTQTPKSIWRIKQGSDSVKVRLTAQPKYSLPSYPDFPVANTVAQYYDTTFPSNTDPDVLNNQFVQYIIKFDNSNQRYSRASEAPILFQVQFNIEAKTSRRRVIATSQPTSIFLSKTLSAGCTGTSCEGDTSNSAPTVRSALFNLLLSLLVFVGCYLIA